MSRRGTGRTDGRRSGRAVVGLLVSVGGLAVAPPALAQDGACELGLVLSGGGARGVAHLGVLEVLEANGVRPDCIAGASMGSVIGSLYASGHSLQQIESMLASLSWRSLYVESHNRSQQGILHRIEQQRTGLRLGISGGGLRTPRGLLSDALVNRLLIEHLAPANFAAGRSFDTLPIPFRTVGTDLRTGDRVVLDRGDLARAVRSSMSVPLAYPAVEWDDAILVDGGLVDNLPVSLAEDMGASFIVAVDVQTPLEEDLVPDLLGVTQRIVDLLFAAKNQQYARAAHLTITPDLGEHSFADYSGFDALIAAGREAAEGALAQIPARYRGRALPPREPPEPHVFGPRTIRDIVVTGNRYLSERTILLEFGPRVGDIIDWRRLLTDLEHFYTARLVQSAWLDLEPVGEDGIRIFLHVQEEYRTTADIGLAYQSADQVQGMLRLETRDLLGSGERLQLSASASSKGRMLGLRLSGEQLFGAHLGYQVDLQAQIERPKVYRMGALVTRAEFDRRDLQLGANLPFGRNHALQLGYRFGDVTVIERLGLPNPAAVDQQRVLVGRYLWDNLNSLSLPLRGRRYRITAERNAGDHRYWRLAFEGHAVQKIGAMVFEGRAVYGYSSDSLPVYEQFRVGGPELLPGLARDELWGDQLLAISAQFGYDPLSLVRVYARVGMGGVWDRQEEINFGDARVGVGVGATVATPFGPIQLDYGWADQQSRRLYFSIGWQ